MKKTILLAASLLALNLTPVFGQPAPILPPKPITPQSAQQFPLPPTTPAADNYQQRLQAIIDAANPQQKPTPELTKFNLDFPGGTPKELVAAIEKATGKPLNVIIPTDDADAQLPPLKMSDVNVQQLFRALEAASSKDVVMAGSGPNGSGPTYRIGYGFTTQDTFARNGVVTDSSIWYFQVTKPVSAVLSEKVCRFFSLSPYLDRGFTVDDITTAIQTGWKMAGETPTPELNYHKETKLLIAYGEPKQLDIIYSVLQSLPSSNAARSELNLLSNQIGQLEDQAAQLKKKISPTNTPPTTVELKSGQ
jgi:hypothetical protein